MAKDKKASITVQGTAITILSHKEEDYISLTRWILTSNAPLCHFTDYFWWHYNETSKLRYPEWSLDIVQ